MTLACSWPTKEIGLFLANKRNRPGSDQQTGLLLANKRNRPGSDQQK